MAGTRTSERGWARLEREIMIGADRDPAVVALRLLEMRHARNPYVLRRRSVWLDELYNLGDPLAPEDVPCDVPSLELLEAILISCGWSTTRNGVRSHVLAAAGCVAEFGVERVADELRAALEAATPDGGARR